MNAPFDWFRSGLWTGLVESLLHSLWIGAAFAFLLALVLRPVRRAEARYTVCLVALVGILIATLVAWAVSDHPASADPGKPMVANSVPRPESTPTVIVASRALSGTKIDANPPPQPDSASSLPAVSVLGEWPARVQPWMALAWCVGTVLMLMRCGLRIGGAERLRRACQPASDPAILDLFAQAQSVLRVTWKVQLVVSEALTTPAVVGWLGPTLILPLSLVTTLTPAQLRLILLHELAHIQRGDYFANLLQMLMESLFFFNPAIWWISRQVRLEREACCDELAVRGGGNRTEYAQVLVQVAEAVLERMPAPALNFGEQRDSSSLSHRVRRLLSPGWNQHLRLSWRALFASFASAGLLLALMALGTRATVGAILTPEKRMERIGQLLTEHGESLRPDSETPTDSEKVEVSGVVTTEDRKPLPKRLYLSATSSFRHSSGVYSFNVKADGSFIARVPPGRISLSALAPGYAPSVSEVIPHSTNRVIRDLVLELKKGYEVPLRALDADTGEPLAGARFQLQFWQPGESSTTFPAQELVGDPTGGATIQRAADLPLTVIMDAEDHERVELRFERVLPGTELVVKARSGGLVAGEVLDKVTGEPIPNAEIRLLGDAAASAAWEWENPSRRLAVTDSAGRFISAKLKRNMASTLGVSAPGRESFVWRDVIAARTNLLARLGPELVVRGEVHGDLAALEGSGTNRYVRWVAKESEHHSRSDVASVVGEQGVGRFQFTNRVAGVVPLFAAGSRFERLVDAPVSNWVVELPVPPVSDTAARVPMRQVTVRLLNPGGVIPRGNVDVTAVEDSRTPGTYARRQRLLENGELKLEVPVGSFVEVAPAKTTLGFWFEKRTENNLPAGSAPLVMDFPVVPAGVITATARTADGLPAADLSFSVRVIRPSKWTKNPGISLDSGDSWSANAGPRRFISYPMPLGGTYQVIAAKGNSFALSPPVTPSEASPNPAVEIQFSPSIALAGKVVGPESQRLPGLRIVPQWSIENRGFQLKEIFTDVAGQFVLEGVTRTDGKYTLEIVPQAEFQAVRQAVDLDRGPLQIRLPRGLKISGTVVQAGTQFVLPRASVRLLDFQGKYPTIQGETDGAGRYEFSNLGDTEYYVHVDGANLKSPGAGKIRPGRDMRLTLECELYPGSELRPLANAK